MAIVIVNPNPVFDRTIALERLVPGSVIRTESVEVTAGGKGINVARVLRSLGIESSLLVPVGRGDREQYSALLDAEGAQATYFEVSGPIRVASIYREHAEDRVTVVNDAGFALPPHEWSQFVDFAASRVHAQDVVLVMGSLPAGLPSDAAAALVDAQHARGAQVLIDTAPRWLQSALHHGPDVVAPNIHEALAALDGAASSVFDDSSMSDEEHRVQAIELSRRIARVTGRIACVTAGSAGVAVTTTDETWWVDAPSVDVVSAVGAGDSFVAGLATRWAADLSSGSSVNWEQAARFGVACAAASCEVVRAGGADVDRIRDLDVAIASPVVVAGSAAESAGVGR